MLILDKRESVKDKLLRKGFLLVWLPFSVLIISALIALSSFSELDDAYDLEIKTNQLIYRSEELTKDFYDASVAIGGYSITKSPVFGERYLKIRNRIPVVLAELRDLSKDDTAKISLLDNMSKLCSEGLAILDESKKTFDAARSKETDKKSTVDYKQIRRIGDKLQVCVLEFTADAVKLRETLPETKCSARRTAIYTLLGVIAVNLILATCLLVQFAFSVSRLLKEFAKSPAAWSRPLPYQGSWGFSGARRKSRNACQYRGRRHLGL